MGIFGTSWDDPRTMGILAAASGLLGNTSSVGEGLGSGLQNFLVGYQTGKKGQREDAAEKRAEEQFKMQQQQYQREVAQQDRQRRASLSLFGAPGSLASGAPPVGQAGAAPGLLGGIVPENQMGILQGMSDAFGPEAIAPHLLGAMFPEPGAGFELSPGETRYDAAGNVLAQVPGDPMAQRKLEAEIAKLNAQAAAAGRIDSTGGGVRGQKIEALIAQGVPRGVAEGVYDGRYEIVPDTVYGGYRVIDKAAAVQGGDAVVSSTVGKLPKEMVADTQADISALTEVRDLAGEALGLMAEPASGFATEGRTTGATGVGLEGWGRRMIGSTVGQVAPEAVSESTVRLKERVDRLKAIASRVYSANPNRTLAVEMKAAADKLTIGAGTSRKELETQLQETISILNDMIGHREGVLTESRSGEPASDDPAAMSDAELLEALDE